MEIPAIAQSFVLLTRDSVESWIFSSFRMHSSPSLVKDWVDCAEPLEVVAASSRRHEAEEISLGSIGRAAD